MMWKILSVSCASGSLPAPLGRIFRVKRMPFDLFQAGDASLQFRESLYALLSVIDGHRVSIFDSGIVDALHEHQIRNACRFLSHATRVDRQYFLSVLIDIAGINVPRPCSKQVEPIQPAEFESELKSFLSLPSRIDKLPLYSTPIAPDQHRLSKQHRSYYSDKPPLKCAEQAFKNMPADQQRAVVTAYYVLFDFEQLLHHIESRYFSNYAAHILACLREMIDSDFRHSLADNGGASSVLEEGLESAAGSDREGPVPHIFTDYRQNLDARAIQQGQITKLEHKIFSCLHTQFSRLPTRLKQFVLASLKRIVYQREIEFCQELNCDMAVVRPRKSDPRPLSCVSAALVFGKKKASEQRKLFLKYSEDMLDENLPMILTGLLYLGNPVPLCFYNENHFSGLLDSLRLKGKTREIQYLLQGNLNGFDDDALFQLLTATFSKILKARNVRSVAEFMFTDSNEIVWSAGVKAILLQGDISEVERKFRLDLSMMTARLPGEPSSRVNAFFSPRIYRGSLDHSAAFEFSSDDEFSDLDDSLSEGSSGLSEGSATGGKVVEAQVRVVDAVTQMPEFGVEALPVHVQAQPVEIEAQAEAGGAQAQVVETHAQPVDAQAQAVEAHAQRGATDAQAEAVDVKAQAVEALVRLDRGDVPTVTEFDSAIPRLMPEVLGILATTCIAQNRTEDADVLIPMITSKETLLKLYQELRTKYKDDRVQMVMDNILKKLFPPQRFTIARESINEGDYQAAVGIIQETIQTFGIDAPSFCRIFKLLKPYDLISGCIRCGVFSELLPLLQAKHDYLSDADILDIANACSELFNEDGLDALLTWNLKPRLKQKIRNLRSTSQ